MPAWLLITIALLAIVLIVLVTIAATQAQLRPSVINPGTPGEIGEAVISINERSGKVTINGEYWAARTRAGVQPIPPGHAVRVVAVRGLRLTVEQLEVEHET
jgi:membrane-bound ClpP family serine protease